MGFLVLMESVLSCAIVRSARGDLHGRRGSGFRMGLRWADECSRSVRGPATPSATTFPPDQNVNGTREHRVMVRSDVRERCRVRDSSRFRTPWSKLLSRSRAWCGPCNSCTVEAFPFAARFFVVLQDEASDPVERYWGTDSCVEAIWNSRDADAPKDDNTQRLAKTVYKVSSGGTKGSTISIQLLIQQSTHLLLYKSRPVPTSLPPPKQ